MCDGFSGFIGPSPSVLPQPRPLPPPPNEGHSAAAPTSSPRCPQVLTLLPCFNLHRHLQRSATYQFVGSFGEFRGGGCCALTPSPAPKSLLQGHARAGAPSPFPSRPPRPTCGPDGGEIRGPGLRHEIRHTHICTHVPIPVCMCIYIKIYMHIYTRIYIYATNECPGTRPHSCVHAGLPQPPQRPGPGGGPGAPVVVLESRVAVPEPRVAERDRGSLGPEHRGGSSIAAQRRGCRGKDRPCHTRDVIRSSSFPAWNLRPRKGMKCWSRFISQGFSPCHMIPAGLWLRCCCGGDTGDMRPLAPLMGSTSPRTDPIPSHPIPPHPSHPIPDVQQRTLALEASGGEKGCSGGNGLHKG